MDAVMTTAAHRLLIVHDASHHQVHQDRVAGAPFPGPSAPAPRASFPKLIPVFILIVLLLCFLSIFLLRDLLLFFSLWLRRRHNADAASSFDNAVAPDADADAPRKAAGLDPAVLAAFPTVRFEEEDASAPECAVCLSEFAAGDAVRLLTVCLHAFHVSCIDSWLSARTTCPVCRCELDAPPRAPGHIAVHQEHEDGGRVAIVVGNRAGAALARHDSGEARSQFDR